MKEYVVKNEREKKYQNSKVNVWYDTRIEAFVGDIKVYLSDNEYISAVTACGNNMGEMIKKLTRDYDNFVYGYNIAMAISNLPSRLKYLGEDKILEEGIK